MMNSDVDRRAIATRLLAALPPRLDRQTESYKRMIRYLKHIESTGSCREEGDIVIVSVYLKRSAVFKTFKQDVAKACLSENNAEIKKFCLELMKKFNEIVEKWGLQHIKLTMQNMKAYQGLLDTHRDYDYEMDDLTKMQRKDFIKQVIGDAEISRVPWQVGKNGEFGDDIEPLDEAFLREIMTGKKAPADILAPIVNAASETQVVLQPEGIRQFSSSVKSDFITKMENVVTPQDVCNILNVPVSAMRVFASALNPAFDWENKLGMNFRSVVIALLTDRKEREKQRPIRMLFDVNMGKKALAGGASYGM